MADDLKQQVGGFLVENYNAQVHEHAWTATASEVKNQRSPGTIQNFACACGATQTRMTAAAISDDVAKREITDEMIGRCYQATNLQLVDSGDAGPYRDAASTDEIRRALDYIMNGPTRRVDSPSQAQTSDSAIVFIHQHSRETDADHPFTHRRHDDLVHKFTDPKA